MGKHDIGPLGIPPPLAGVPVYFCPAQTGLKMMAKGQNDSQLPHMGITLYNLLRSSRAAACSSLPEC